MAHSHYSNSVHSNSSVVDPISHLLSDIHISVTDDSCPTPQKSRDEVAYHHDIKCYLNSADLTTSAPVKLKLNCSYMNQSEYSGNLDQWMGSGYERSFQLSSPQYQYSVPPHASFPYYWTVPHHPYMHPSNIQPSVTSSLPSLTHNISLTSKTNMPNNKIKKHLFSSSISKKKNKNPIRTLQTPRKSIGKMNQQIYRIHRWESKATLAAYVQKESNRKINYENLDLWKDMDEIHKLYVSLKREKSKKKHLIEELEIRQLYNEMYLLTTVHTIKQIENELKITKNSEEASTSGETD